jgi:hypothetical protein
MSMPKLLKTPSEESPASKSESPEKKKLVQDIADVGGNLLPYIVSARCESDCAA